MTGSLRSTRFCALITIVLAFALAARTLNRSGAASAAAPPTP